MFPAKEIWGTCAPLRACSLLLGWQYGGTILTMDSLLRNGWSMIYRCGVCKVSEKSSDYNLIHCDGAI